MEHGRVEVHQSLYPLAVPLSLSCFLEALVLDLDAPELEPHPGFHGDLLVGMFPHLNDVVKVPRTT